MPQDGGNSLATATGITAITVEGYKSIAERRTIDVRPLTVLAGANSSGKSSMIQPLLLIKQTLEATYDPGLFKLDGPNVEFDNLAEMRARGRAGPAGSLLVGVDAESDHTSVEFGWLADGLEPTEFRWRLGGREAALRPDMETEELRAVLRSMFGLAEMGVEKARLQVLGDRCFLSFGMSFEHILGGAPGRVSPPVLPSLQALTHVPALRGNPKRAYPTAATGPFFPGLFQGYFAAVLHRWHEDGDPRHRTVSDWMSDLGLTWRVDARRASDTRIEIMVGRLPRARRNDVSDLVNIADVGFGVSQVLPVVVALVAAIRGDTVYIEQPEIHLHPRAHDGLARLLADAATRGVRVIAETHSSLLLRAIQTAVAEGAMPREDVILHWFSRDDDGVTQVTPADLDRAGSFGDWPEDFGEVQLEAAERYVTAAEKAMQEAPA